jgi:hypothetical protein
MFLESFSLFGRSCDRQRPRGGIPRLLDPSGHRVGDRSPSPWPRHDHGGPDEKIIVCNVSSGHATH